MSEIEPFSDALIDEVVAALDIENRGRFWVELKHMEANSFDLAWQQPSIRGALIGSYESPFFERGGALPHVAERQLVLQLRARLRDELSLPPLSDDERRLWAYDRLEWKKHSFTDPHEKYDEAPRLSGREIASVVDHIKTNDPRIISYLRSVRKHNSAIMKTDESQLIWCMWISYYVKDQVMRLLKPNGSTRTAESEREIVKRLENDHRCDSAGRGVESLERE